MHASSNTGQVFEGEGPQGVRNSRIEMQGTDFAVPFPSPLDAANCQGTEDRLAECPGALRTRSGQVRFTDCISGSVDLVCFNSTGSGARVSYACAVGTLQIAQTRVAEHGVGTTCGSIAT